jgi:hypothetical protein
MRSRRQNQACLSTSFGRRRSKWRSHTRYTGHWRTHVSKQTKAVANYLDALDSYMTYPEIFPETPHLSVASARGYLLTWRGDFYGSRQNSRLRTHARAFWNRADKERW